MPVIEDLDETSEQHDVTHTLPTREEESDDEENYDVTMNKEKLPSTDTNYFEFLKIKKLVFCLSCSIFKMIFMS